MFKEKTAEDISNSKITSGIVNSVNEVIGFFQGLSKM
jgi:hypothetical protein